MVLSTGIYYPFIFTGIDSRTTANWNFHPDRKFHWMSGWRGIRSDLCWIPDTFYLRLWNIQEYVKLVWILFIPGWWCCCPHHPFVLFPSYCRSCSSLRNPGSRVLEVEGLMMKSGKAWSRDWWIFYEKEESSLHKRRMWSKKDWGRGCELTCQALTGSSYGC